MLPRPRRLSSVSPAVASATLAAVLLVGCTGLSAGSAPAASAPASTASAPAASTATGASIAVTVSPDGCRPGGLRAVAGRVVFEVTNGGSDAGEFEVLSGTKVVGEVEDLVPGVAVSLSLGLEAGSYDLICYGDDAPRGTLTVSPS
jgi:iron uptake system EfeUOB component EfeO/EfeM